MWLMAWNPGMPIMCAVKITRQLSLFGNLGNNNKNSTFAETYESSPFFVSIAYYRMIVNLLLFQYDSGVCSV